MNKRLCSQTSGADKHRSTQSCCFGVKGWIHHQRNFISLWFMMIHPEAGPCSNTVWNKAEKCVIMQSASSEEPLSACGWPEYATLLRCVNNILPAHTITQPQCENEHRLKTGGQSAVPGDKNWTNILTCSQTQCSIFKSRLLHHKQQKPDRKMCSFWIKLIRGNFLHLPLIHHQFITMRRRWPVINGNMIGATFRISADYSLCNSAVTVSVHFGHLVQIKTVLIIQPVSVWPTFHKHWFTSILHDRM